jgi:hypothetical protein
VDNANTEASAAAKSAVFPRREVGMERDTEHPSGQPGITRLVRMKGRSREGARVFAFRNLAARPDDDKSRRGVRSLIY